jgi:hypothetical protein
MGVVCDGVRLASRLWCIAQIDLLNRSPTSNVLRTLSETESKNVEEISYVKNSRMD